MPALALTTSETTAARLTEDPLESRRKSELPRPRAVWSSQGTTLWESNASTRATSENAFAKDISALEFLIQPLSITSHL